MKAWVWSVGLWLVGIGPLAAMDITQPETLRYRLYWGPLTVGYAQLEYVPQGDRYRVKAEVKDDSRLIDLHDVWQVEGQHTAKRAFVPEVYKVKQAENNYRADKAMVFDRKAGQVVYTNYLDPSDTAEPLVLGEARDVLSTVYAWRQASDAEIGKAERLPMVSLKREIVLTRTAGEKVRLNVAGKPVAAWKVTMRVIKNGKPSKDVWTVYVSDEVQRTPLEISAATKFGTFRAVLK